MRTIPLLLLALGAIAAAETDAAQPRPGVLVAYRSIFGQRSSVPSDGGFRIGHSHGRYPIFAIRLLHGISDESLAAQVSSPGNYDRVALHARDVDPESGGSDAHSRLSAAVSLLERAIWHHRPPTRLELARSGRVRVIGSPTLARYERCARRLLERASDAVIAAAPPRRHDLERRRRDLSIATATLPLEGPSLLLRVIQLRLPPVIDGRWSASQRRLSETADADETPDQFSWNMEQVRLHGREAGLEIDLMSSPNGPAARICRSLQLDRTGAPVSDRCSIGGFIDRRDGWPLVITVSRTVKTADRGEANRNVTFSRLAPLEGFLAPAAHCTGR